MLQQVKERVSVLELLEVLGVRVKGKTACCPLHPDKTPSFSFNRKGQWYCFVCGVGGDICTLVMKSQGLSFKDSLTWLNDRFSLGLTNKKPKRNFYLEAINENYKAFKDDLNQEFDENCRRAYELFDQSRGRHYPYLFWTAKDYTFELTYNDRQDKIESQLRELENARFKLRREASQSVNS